MAERRLTRRHPPRGGLGRRLPWPLPDPDPRLPCLAGAGTALDLTELTTEAPILLELLRRHYVAQALQQSYLVLGAADALGNPVNLLRGIAHGVGVFFSAPAQGLAHGST